MTSQGSAYARFRRALATRNLLLVRAAAAEPERIDLRNALEVCVLMHDAEPGVFERAAVRWIGRLALDDLRHAGEALAKLPNRASLELLRQLARH